MSFFGLQYMPDTVSKEVASHPDVKTRRYAVIGAGAAGICAMKYLKQAGAENIVCYEIGTQIGGLWCYNNDSGLSSAYSTLHINTVRTFTRFSDLDLPSDVQDFPHHSDMYQYFKDYVAKHDLMRYIRFKSRVTDVRRADNYSSDAPKWVVETESGATDTYDSVIVASGHLSSPRHVKEFEAFGGKYMHAHYYREPADFVGKSVCVVGAANSAFDVCSDICVVAKRTTMVARSGVIVFPKTVFGIPFGDITLHLNRRVIPNWLRRNLSSFLVYMMHGDMTKLGFKKQTKWQHTTSNGTLVSHLNYRRVIVKHGIERIDGKRIHFVDGTSEDFDALIAATGYDLDMPFLAHDLVQTDGSNLDLYKRIVPPGQNGLYLLGYVNTSVALNQMFERQMHWILAVDSGESALPNEAEMHRDIEAKRQWVMQRYGGSERYALEEPHLFYFPELERSRAEGKARRNDRGQSGGVMQPIKKQPQSELATAP